MQETTSATGQTPTTETLDISGHRFRALIFDCDGTLADTAMLHYRAMCAAIAHTGVDLPYDWYAERVGVSQRPLLDQFAQAFGVKPDIDRAGAIIAERQRTEMHQVKEIAAVARIARDHAGKVPMTVASGGQRATVEATLNTIGLRALFDHVVTVEDVASGKPSPDLFLLAAARMGVPPADCLVFEDSKEGLEAAHRAGMRVIDVTPYRASVPAAETV